MPQPPLDFASLLARGAYLAPAPGAGALPTAPTISFGAGLPDPAFIPIDDLVAASERVLRRDGPAALQYGGLYGYEGLRDFIAGKSIQDDGAQVERDQVFLTTGSSQALSLLCFAFVDPGDTVIVESPTFGMFIRTLRSYCANIVSVPIDDQGLRLDSLKRKLAQLRRRGVRPKLLYTMPNFHNPAGVTMSAERRRRLVELAREAGLLLVEDDVYGDLRYEGAPLPSLFSLDDSGGVVRLGSFSKILAAGLRVGWAVGHRDAIAAVASVRHDLGISPFLARTVAEYVSTGKLEPHIHKLIGVYRSRRDRMLAALGEYCGPWVRWRKPEGGFYVWVELAEGIDPGKLAAAAAQEGVSYVPGVTFHADGGGRRRLRLAFGSLPPDDIDKGIAALGRALAKARG